MSGLFILAFGAGLLAPVNPCGFAVLPAVLAHGMSSATTGPRGVWARLSNGLRSGFALSLGFTGTFTLVGVLVAIGLRPLLGVVPWAAAALGAVFVLLGLALLLGVSIPLGFKRLNSLGQSNRSRGMVALGVGYALASASCSLALLLAVVTQALAGTGWSSVLLVFAAYAVGSTVLLVTLAVMTSFASTAISRYLRKLLPHMNRITGVVLALSGAYLLVYWLPQLLGRPAGTTALSVVAGPISDWISGNQLVVVIVAVGLVLTIVAAGLVRRAVSSRKVRSLHPESSDRIQR